MGRGGSDWYGMDNMDRMGYNIDSIRNRHYNQRQLALEPSTPPIISPEMYHLKFCLWRKRNKAKFRQLYQGDNGDASAGMGGACSSNDFRFMEQRHYDQLKLQRERVDSDMTPSDLAKMYNEARRGNFNGSGIGSMGSPRRAGMRNLPSLMNGMMDSMNGSRDNIDMDYNITHGNIGPLHGMGSGGGLNNGPICPRSDIESDYGKQAPRYHGGQGDLDPDLPYHSPAPFHKPSMRSYLRQQMMDKMQKQLMDKMHRQMMDKMHDIMGTNNVVSMDDMGQESQGLGQGGGQSLNFHSPEETFDSRDMMQRMMSSNRRNSNTHDNSNDNRSSAMMSTFSKSPNSLKRKLMTSSLAVSGGDQVHYSPRSPNPKKSLLERQRIMESEMRNHMAEALEGFRKFHGGQNRRGERDPIASDACDETAEAAVLGACNDARKNTPDHKVFIALNGVWYGRNDSAFSSFMGDQKFYNTDPLKDNVKLPSLGSGEEPATSNAFALPPIASAGPMAPSTSASSASSSPISPRKSQPTAILSKGGKSGKAIKKDKGKKAKLHKKKHHGKSDKTQIEKPKRPFSAYNLFFQLEREYIMQSIAEGRSLAEEDLMEGQEKGEENIAMDNDDVATKLEKGNGEKVVETGSNAKSLENN